METFKNSQRRQGSHSGDKSDGPWRWFRSCHAKDVISGQAGGLWSRGGRRQGPWPPPSRQVLPPCLSGTLPRARQTGRSPRAPQPGGGGVRTLWALLTLCHPTPSPTAPLLGSPHSSCHSSLLSHRPKAVPVECCPSFPGHWSLAQTPVQLWLSNTLPSTNPFQSN